eukprot:594249_1
MNSKQNFYCPFVRLAMFDDIQSKSTTQHFLNFHQMCSLETTQKVTNQIWIDLYSLSSIQRTAIRSSLSSHHPSTISISETSTLTLVSSCRKCATMICVQNSLNFPCAAFSLADIITMTNYYHPMQYTQIKHSLAIRFLLTFALFCLMTIDATANDTRRDRATTAALFAMTRPSKNGTRLFSHLLESIDGFGYEKHCNALLHNKTEKSRDELGLAMLLNACNCQASDFDDGILVINTPCTGTINPYDLIMKHCNLLPRLRYLRFYGVGPLTFNGFPNHLTYLTIQNTKIKHIHQNALSQLHNLTVLYLGNNGLTTSDVSSYRLPPNLVSLSLKNNNLSTIDIAFPQSLRNLHLDTNYFDGDPLHPLLILSQFEVIGLSNSLQNGFKINWTHQMFEKVRLKQLYLWDNPFTCAQLNLHQLVQSLPNSKHAWEKLTLGITDGYGGLNISACLEQLNEDLESITNATITWYKERYSLGVKIHFRRTEYVSSTDTPSTDTTTQRPAQRTLRVGDETADAGL